MHPNLKQLEQVHKLNEHPYWKHAIKGVVAAKEVFAEMGFVWEAPHSCRVSQYIACHGSAEYNRLFELHDRLVWACAAEFLKQYLDEQASQALQVLRENQAILVDFERVLLETETDFVYEVCRSEPTVGYLQLSELLAFFDSQIPATLKGLLPNEKPRFNCELVPASGERPDITQLLEHYSNLAATKATTFTLGDVLEVFKLPYYRDTVRWFDYSDRVTPLIYAADLGYAEVVDALATYYGRDALLLECEDNSTYDGYRVALVNLMCSQPDAAKQLMHKFNINQKTCDELMSLFGPPPHDRVAVIYS